MSKAGINTTLNTRCTVLAAANPVKGRYTQKKSVSWNVGLPSALVSRFDAVKVMRDAAGKQDEEVAEHVLRVHKGKGVVEGAISAKELGHAIRKAKSIRTTLGRGVEERIVEAYACEREKHERTGGRNRDAKDAKDANKDSRDANRSANRSANEKETPGTARRVLSVLRLSQALAKAHGKTVVGTKEVEEVLRLLGSDDTGRNGV